MSGKSTKSSVNMRDGQDSVYTRTRSAGLRHGGRHARGSGYTSSTGHSEQHRNLHQSDTNRRDGLLLCSYRQNEECVLVQECRHVAGFLCRYPTVEVVGESTSTRRLWTIFIVSILCCMTCSIFFVWSSSNEGQMWRSIIGNRDC